jgi:hypothetical protein
MAALGSAVPLTTSGLVFSVLYAASALFMAAWYLKEEPEMRARHGMAFFVPSWFLRFFVLGGLGVILVILGNTNEGAQVVMPATNGRDIGETSSVWLLAFGGVVQLAEMFMFGFAKKKFKNEKEPLLEANQGPQYTSGQ